MKLAALLIAWMLSGCAELSALRTGVATEGANAMDRAATDAEFTLCRAISIGAWMRRYGRDETKAQAWRDICLSPDTEAPVK